MSDDHSIARKCAINTFYQFKGNIMKVAFKSLIAAAAFISVATAASAAIVTVPSGGMYKGAKLTGNEVFSLSVDTLGVFDVLAAQVTAVSPAQGNIIKDSDGFFSAASVTSALTSLAVNEDTDEDVSLSAGGGFTVTSPIIRSVSSGGTITLTDLKVDLSSKKVFATVVGANGVGTVTNVAMWDFDTVVGATSVGTWGGSGVFNSVVSGLRFTTDGLSKFISALGLSTLGKAALNGVTDFGSIALTVNMAPAPVPACAVSFKTTNKTALFFNTEVTVHNAGSNAATGWQVNWAYNKSTLLANIKDAKITGDKDLKHFTAKPVAGNKVIAAGGATTFTFKGHANGGAPTAGELSATLGGQTCPVTAQ